MATNLGLQKGDQFSFADGVKYSYGGNDTAIPSTIMSGVQDLTSKPTPTNLLTSTPLTPPTPAATPNPDGLVAGVTATTKTQADAAANTATTNPFDPQQTAQSTINGIYDGANTPAYNNALANEATYQQDYVNASNALVGKGQAQLGYENQYGVGDTFKKLQENNLRLANLTSAYDTSLAKMATGPGSTEFVTGALAQQKMMKAAEVGALAAYNSALQGNFTLARDYAQHSVDLQFADQQQRLDNAKNFLDINKETLTREDTNRKKKIEDTITERQAVLDRQKDARKFALENGITKKFYQVGETIFDTTTGLPYNSVAEYIKAGGTKDFSNVQKITQTISKDDVFGSPEAGYYYLDKVTKQPVQVIAPISKFAVNPLTGTLFNEKTGGGPGTGFPSTPGLSGGPLVSANPNPTKVVAGYDLTTYATDPQHGIKVNNILSGIPQNFSTPQDIDAYIQRKKPGSPITGAMVIAQASAYGIDPRVLVALMEEETQLGTDGSKGAKGYNFGNVGNTDSLMAAGGSVSKPTPESGVAAVAENLAKRKISTTTNRDPVDDLVDQVTKDPKVYGQLTTQQQTAVNFRLASQNKPIPTLTKELTAEQQKQKDNAESGITAIDQLFNVLDDKEQGIGAIKSALIQPYGTRAQTIRRARAEAADIVTRLRTGAALNDEEQKTYSKLLPGLFDTEDSARYKLAQLKQFYQLFTASPEQTFPEFKKKMAAQLQPGEILVQDKTTGQFGGIQENEYDATKYMKLTY